MLEVGRSMFNVHLLFIPFLPVPGSPRLPPPPSSVVSDFLITEYWPLPSVTHLLTFSLSLFSLSPCPRFPQSPPQSSAFSPSHRLSSQSVSVCERLWLISNRLRQPLQRKYPNQPPHRLRLFLLLWLKQMLEPLVIIGNELSRTDNSWVRKISGPIQKPIRPVDLEVFFTYD